MKLLDHLPSGHPSSDDRPAANASAMSSGRAPEPDDSADDECYRLMSIDAVGAPEGCTGSDWHIYRIMQGENGITGYRNGELARVTADVEMIVTALNERRQWTKSKGISKHQRRAAAASRRANVR